ncbi:hypothetical protein J2Z35_002321 [Acetoanaerobium pronyense]|uniref:Uncharacterized protein n=1 Tax=Acetoanaerobium pronyense TaxID=1482736 RepID=A0ABS4KL33_9FIRM|nr:hypothetical protein [Acetoanaerobium pronyense]MBP2028496.1 hypothetical protein [Acetoanaerobium pronyense]
MKNLMNILKTFPNIIYIDIPNLEKNKILFSPISKKGGSKNV